MKRVLILIVAIATLSFTFASCSKRESNGGHPFDSESTDITEGQPRKKPIKYYAACELQAALDKKDSVIDCKAMFVDVAEALENKIGEDGSGYSLQYFSFDEWDEEYIGLEKTKSINIMMQDVGTNELCGIHFEYKNPNIKSEKEDFEKINEKLYVDTYEMSTGRIRKSYYYLINDDYYCGFAVMHDADGKTNTEFEKMMVLISEIEQIVIRSS